MTFQFARNARPLYAASARFDGTARALGEDEMRRLAPSIFATAAHESRSDRFRPIPTIEVLRGVMAEGFMPVAVKQCTTRDPGKADFTKHLIRMRRLDDAKYQAGDTVCEVLLQNGNDGTSAYNLMAGLFRILCLNSLVCQTGTIDTVKIRHSGDVQTKVIEGTYHVLEEAQKALVAPADWSKINLNVEERFAYAEAARIIRFGDAEGNVPTGALPAPRLLDVRREKDIHRDLWTTFNVVQENAVKGGLTGTRYTNGQRRRFTTREIKGIDQDVKLNKALWVLTEALAKAKQAA